MGTTNTLDLNNRVSRLEKSGGGGGDTSALVNKTDIAPEFSDATNYNAGDLVYYNGLLYEFQLDHTAGAWEQSEVQNKDLSDIINNISDSVDEVAEAVDAIAAVAGQKAYGTPVDIKSYTSENQYTCPSDGIVLVNPGSTSDNHYAALYAVIANEVRLMARVFGHAGIAASSSTVPVLKDTHLYAVTESGTSTPIVTFIPYVAAT